MEAWQVSPHQRQASRHRPSGRGSARGGVGTSARQGCGGGNRARSVAYRWRGARVDGNELGGQGCRRFVQQPHRLGQCARERAGCVRTAAHSRRERATRVRMPQRETRPRRDARARECGGG
eukprot:518366-Prymnesium_polylepis.2